MRSRCPFSEVPTREGIHGEWWGLVGDLSSMLDTDVIIFVATVGTRGSQPFISLVRASACLTMTAASCVSMFFAADSPITVEDLQPGTSYAVVAAARNQKGLGPFPSDPTLSTTFVTEGQSSSDALWTHTS